MSVTTIVDAPKAFATIIVTSPIGPAPSTATLYPGYGETLRQTNITIQYRCVYTSTRAGENESAWILQQVLKETSSANDGAVLQEVERWRHSLLSSFFVY